MRLEEFRIGMEFNMSGKKWRCTDVGTRTIAAIKIDPEATIEQVSYEQGFRKVVKTKVGDNESWYNGPPYAVPEYVINEYDLTVCRPIA